MSSTQRIQRELRTGFTLVELLVVIAVIGVLLAILLPAVRVSGEAARRMTCNNNLKQLGLALHNYHDAYGHLPSAMGGTGIGTTSILGNANRLSGWVALLPYIEQTQLWQQISAPLEVSALQKTISVLPFRTTKFTASIPTPSGVRPFRDH